MTDKWEYMNIRQEINWGLNNSPNWEELDDLWKRANDLGQQGWEMVNTMTGNNSGGWTRWIFLSFKRPIKT